MASIVSGIEFNVENDYVYTKARVNANGRKQIGILNKSNKKSFYMSTPLMLTWGVNAYTDEKTGEVQSYDMALQFPNDEYNNPDCITFLKNMQALELKLKADAISNSKDWLNKAKTTPDAIDALWSPMLKYPKDKETGEPDYSRAPTLKVKIPFWEGEYKNVELYNDERVLLFPTDENDSDIGSLIVKGSNVATIIQCGGIWVANGKFGVTWKLFQAVVKPRVTLSGKCHITLSDKEKEQMHLNSDDGDEEISELATKTHNTKVDDSDDDDSHVVEPSSSSVHEEVKAEITAKTVTTEDAPKKKRVIKKKSTTDE